MSSRYPWSFVAGILASALYATGICGVVFAGGVDGHRLPWWSISVLGNAAEQKPIGAAQQYDLGSPFGVMVGPDGGLYVTEVTHHRVLRLDRRSGTITVVAGTGEAGYTGDGGPAVKARLREPYEVRFDDQRNMYVVEMKNHIVRRIRHSDGVIETVAGTGEAGYGGDGGPATQAQLNRPHSIEVRGDELFIADIGNHRIRVVDLKTGRMATLAGNGERALPEDGSNATGRAVAGPRALSVDGDQLWVVLREGHSVWRLDLKNKTWTHVAGTGKPGYAGDGGAAQAAQFNGPKGIALGHDGNVYISDTENHAIRRIDLSSGKIETIAGGGASLAGDGCPAREAKLARPHGVAVDAAGRVYVADTEQTRIQLVTRRMRVGIIGLDTSHVVAFTGILNRPDAPALLQGAPVVAAYPIGSADIESSVSRRDGYVKTLREKWNVKIVKTIPELLDQVDAVLLESNDGRPHLAQAIPVLQRRMPLFIDKPIAGSLADAVSIFALARHWNTPVFSSSSLRFARSTQDARHGQVGRVWMANTYSPCSLEATHPDLYWYGIHGVESLFTVMGRGCESVRRIHAPALDVVSGQWRGGRAGTFQGLRPPLARGYGGRVFGEKGAMEVGNYDGYQPLLLEIIEFFRTGRPPVTPDETLEIYAFMTAADVSKQRGGAVVTLEEVMRDARQRSSEFIARLLKQDSGNP